MASLSRQGEAMVREIERFQPLDSIGRTVAGWFSTVVRPGWFKDLLSGTWLGHPAHPMLTDLPIGAWMSALAFDALGGDAAADASTTLIGIGVLTALPTAVTGLSDLSDVVKKEDRSLGVAHALGNLTALALYALSYVQRRRGRRGNGMALSLVGGAVASGSAYLGGHLVYRRAVGPDQTALDRPIRTWTPVIDDAALTDRQPKRVTVSGTDVLLYREDRRTYALADRCSHRGGPLDKGEVGDGRVTCPWHLSTFDLDDGSIIRGPATAPQPVYEVRVRDGKIEVRGPR